MTPLGGRDMLVRHSLGGGGSRPGKARSCPRIQNGQARGTKSFRVRLVNETGTRSWSAGRSAGRQISFDFDEGPA